MKSNNTFLALIVLGLLLLSGCAGKHNIPTGATMDLVAIKYDAALLLAENFSLHSGAESSFREILEVAPRFAEAHYNLAIALAHQSQWDEAMLEFDRALVINPNFELAVIGRALAQRMLKNGQPSTDIEIPRYCQVFHKLYELGC